MTGLVLRRLLSADRSNPAEFPSLCSPGQDGDTVGAKATARADLSPSRERGTPSTMCAYATARSFASAPAWIACIGARRQFGGYGAILRARRRRLVLVCGRTARTWKPKTFITGAGATPSVPSADRRNHRARAGALAADSPKQRTAPLSAAWLRANLERFRDQAIDDPTTRNVALYLYLQRLVLDKAERFAEATQRAVWADPLLDETTRRPLATFAANLVNREAGAAREAALAAIARPGADSSSFTAPQAVPTARHKRPAWNR